MNYKGSRGGGLESKCRGGGPLVNTAYQEGGTSKTEGVRTRDHRTFHTCDKASGML